MDVARLIDVWRGASDAYGEAAVTARWRSPSTRWRRAGSRERRSAEVAIGGANEAALLPAG